MEQFIFAIDRDGKYTFLKSPRVMQLITDGNLENLRQKRVDLSPYWLSTEQIVAFQHVEQVLAEKRVAFFNHTLLIPILEYLRYPEPYSFFSKLLLTSKDELPASLRSL